MPNAQQPPQHQPGQPGREQAMQPPPEYLRSDYRACGKLTGRVALITGGDSGIGRAVALAFALEGADLAIAYLNEHDDAQETQRRVREAGRQCVLLPGDLADEAHCRDIVARTVTTFGRLDVLVNNAGEQHERADLTEIDAAQLERTFRTNVFAMFHVTAAALPHLKPGAAVVNSASVTAYVGHPTLMDYAASKGAIVAFTRSLAVNLAGRGIRVNAVAPGPIWTPLIPATFSAEHVAKFGASKPLGRAGQPSEVAPCFVFLACADASYMTGQVLHPNGGEIVNG